jgi:hypothetical protein
MNSDRYVFSKQPGFVETEMRKAFKQAVPLRTVVVYCYDPARRTSRTPWQKPCRAKYTPARSCGMTVVRRLPRPPRFFRLWLRADVRWTRYVQ